MDFSGKYALVTGGSRGIGRACVEAFAKHGARVAINYHHNADAAQDTIDRLPGGPHLMIKADVSDPNSVKELIERVTNDFDGLDIVVNNAGISQKHPIDEIEYNTWQEAWQRVMAV